LKLLIIKSAKESSWGSCKVISPNLHRLYEELSQTHEIEWCTVPENILKDEIQSSESSVINIANKITSWKPDRIVFIDHLPPHAKIIAFLSLLIDKQLFPPIIFHVYGDFTYFSKEWAMLNELLAPHRVKFIVASQAQKKLLSIFLQSMNEEAIDVLPFPYNLDEYYFSSDLRQSTRNQYQLSTEDFVILYSGRISLQKNVDVLINAFSQLENKQKKIHLWIVGGFDDVGADFMGIESYHGYMYSKIQKLLEKMSPDLRSNIKFFGHTNKKRLLEIKCASDMYVSLSTYHDEDFGMSPAEAMATGLPSVLTSWGGYSSFFIEGYYLKFVDVKMTEYGLKLNLKQIFDSVDELMAKRISDEWRMEQSKLFEDKFSISSNVKNLKNILSTNPSEFLGFNWKLEQLSNAQNLSWHKSKLNKLLTPASNTFYFEIYKNYVNQESYLNEH
jgi:glycosyltransferase involved in cell wall biosynthesis